MIHHRWVKLARFLAYNSGLGEQGGQPVSEHLLAKPVGHRDQITGGFFLNIGCFQVPVMRQNDILGDLPDKRLNSSVKCRAVHALTSSLNALASIVGVYRDIPVGEVTGPDRS